MSFMDDPLSSFAGQQRTSLCAHPQPPADISALQRDSGVVLALPSLTSTPSFRGLSDRRHVLHRRLVGDDLL